MADFYCFVDFKRLVGLFHVLRCVRGGGGGGEWWSFSSFFFGGSVLLFFIVKLGMGELTLIILDEKIPSACLWSNMNVYVVTLIRNLLSLRRDTNVY